MRFSNRLLCLTASLALLSSPSYALLGLLDGSDTGDSTSTTTTTTALDSVTSTISSTVTATSTTTSSSSSSSSATKTSTKSTTTAKSTHRPPTTTKKTSTTTKKTSTSTQKPTATPSRPVKCVSKIKTVKGSVRPYQMVDSPSVPHSPAWGWTRLAAGGSEVCLGDLHRTIALFPGSAATVPLYESNDVDRSQVTRVVLGVQALGADGWHYFTNLVNTRNKAWGNNAGFDKSKVSVVLPQFIRQADRDAGAATPTDLWFDPNTYGYGGSALGPATVLNGRTIGTFDVLDATIQWIEARYPKVQRIVLVGHSLGAQMIQRYGYLRRDGQPGKARIDYAIMNAGSYAYPLKYRPRSVDTCPQYDSWPFGLSSSADPSSVPPYAATAASQFGRKGLINRYATRNVHILLGSEDYASGTAKCGAIVQGKFHLSRGRFYAAAVINATGTTQAFQAAGGMNRLQSSIPRGQAGLPAPWTYDIVPGCAHSQECMYQSDAGIRRIMLDGYSASGSAAAAAVSRRSATGVGRSHLDVLVDEEED